MGNIRTNKTLQKQTARYLTEMIAVGILMAVCAFLSGYFFLSKHTDTGQYKVEFALAVAAAEDEDYGKLAEYDCVLADTSGTILFSSIQGQETGEHVNLHRFSTVAVETADESIIYVSPILNEGTQVATLMVYRKAEKAFISNLGYIFLTIFLILFLILLSILHFFKKTMKRDVFEPIEMLKGTATKILHGDYGTKLPYDGDNELGGFCRELELMRDELEISRQREEKLRDNEKMITACISHDLKTPIATIIGCAEAIENGLVKDQKSQNHMTGTIISKSMLLTNLINDMLEFAGSEMDELTVQFEEVYADEFFKKAFDELQVDVETAGLSMTVEKIPDVLLSLSSDRMKQVLQNIIGNSIKYTEPGGKITVQFESDGNRFSVMITDNGQGIAAGDIPFIFDKFYRGEKARTQKSTSGSGLGLCIVKNIITRHGGMVKCDSVLGKGTTIRFTLPKG